MLLVRFQSALDESIKDAKCWRNVMVRRDIWANEILGPVFFVTNLNADG